MSEMTERVAAAIRETIGTRHQSLPEGGWDGLMKLAAVAAIEAMRKPTNKMIDAGAGNLGDLDVDFAPHSETRRGAREAWRDMVSAALTS